MLYVLQMFTKPFNQWYLFRIGLIDKNGEIVRKPKTEEERRLLSPMFVLLLSLYKDLMPAYRSRHWAAYQVAYSRIFIKNIVKESEGCEAAPVSAATTTANVDPLPGPLGMVRRKAPTDVKVKRISKKKMKKIKDGQKLNEVVGDLVHEAQCAGERYLVLFDGEQYHKERI